MRTTLRKPFFASKLICLLAFTLLSFQDLKAQVEWAPIGAEWHYTFHEGATYNYDLHYFKVLKDTVVLDKACRMLEKTINYAEGTEESSILFTYKNNDSVYYYIPNQMEEFGLLYDFTAELGDNIVFNAPVSANLETFEVNIDSINSLNLSGQDFNQWVSSTVDGTYLLESYNDRFGSYKYLIPYPGISNNGFDYFLRCYSDDQLDHQIEEPCNFYGVINSTNESSIDKVILFPNPAKNFIAIKNLENIRNYVKFRIFSMTGKIILEGEFTNNYVDVSSLESGIYIFSLELLDNNLRHEILIIR